MKPAPGSHQSAVTTDRFWAEETPVVEGGVARDLKPVCPPPLPLTPHPPKGPADRADLSGRRYRTGSALATFTRLFAGRRGNSVAVLVCGKEELWRRNGLHD